MYNDFERDGDSEKTSLTLGCVTHWVSHIVTPLGKGAFYGTPACRDWQTSFSTSHTVRRSVEASGIGVLKTQ